MPQRYTTPYAACGRPDTALVRPTRGRRTRPGTARMCGSLSRRVEVVWVSVLYVAVPKMTSATSPVSVQSTSVNWAEVSNAWYSAAVLS